MGSGSGVRAIGKSAIQINITLPGHRRIRKRLKLEPTAKNLKYAQGLKSRIDDEIARKVFSWEKTFGEPEPGSGGTTVKQQINAWLDDIKGDVSEGTHDEYTVTAAQFCAARPPQRPGEPQPPTFGDTELSRIKLRDVEDWLAATPRSARRQANLLIPIRGAISNAMRREELDKDPLAAGVKIKNRSASSKVLDPFTPAEIELLSGATVLGPMWQLWAWTGLRTGEIAGLAWHNVDFTAGTITIIQTIRRGRVKPPKTEAGKRSFKLLPPALAALETQRAASADTSPLARVFINPATDKPFTSDRQVLNAFKRAAAQVGVRYRYAYQLRHSFASAAVAAGEPLKWVARCLGHKNDDATMVLRTYARFLPELYEDAGSKMLARWTEKSVP